VGIFRIYFLTKFNVPFVQISLIIAIKPEDEVNLLVTKLFCSFTVCKNKIYLQNLLRFSDQYYNIISAH